jgi:putative transposase
VINRGVRKLPIFLRPADYRAFLLVLREGLDRYPIQLLSYCILSNHWHLVVGPDTTPSLSRFVKWVAATHAIRWHHRHETIGQGPLYQGRFQALPIDGAADLVRVCRYVERNGLAAGLVQRAQDWPWCSLSQRLRVDDVGVPLVTTPFLASTAWCDHVNAPATAHDLVEEQRWKLKIKPGPTSGTLGPETVEKSPVPLRDAPPA